MNKVLERVPMLAFKIGVKAYLADGERKISDAAPILDGGKILLPTSALTGGVKGKTVDKGGVSYTEADTLGLYVKYDTMGLVAIDREPWVTELCRKKDTDYMLELMGEFIYDIEKVRFSGYGPATEEERAGFMRIGEDLRKRLIAHSPSHPYIHADAEKFAKLKKLYEEKNEAFFPAMQKIVDRAENALKDEKYKLNEEGTGLAAPLTNPHPDGYDEGGRLGDAGNHTSTMRNLAFAYQLTGKELFAKTAYYIGIEVGKWDHWGTGHFLNAAGTMQEIALAYDWLWQAWKSMKLDTGAIRRIIYEKGIKTGFDSAIFDKCDFPSPRQGTGWRFKAKPDNWNAVCNSGLVVACLSFLSEGEDESVNAEMIANATETLGLDLSSLTQPLLVMKQYAPDGSYVESPSYWSYGTNNLFCGMAAIYTALGTDLGLSKTWGLDKTCYYAINTESAEYVGWNYHDGGLGAQDTSWFNGFAALSGDSMLYAIRDSQIKRGKAMGWTDMVYHPLLTGAEVPELSALPLDCYMEGIDALTVRDGWERGSLYAGIIGGCNPSGGSHSQIDSGAFIYHNKGHLWLTDLGSDNYNISRADGGYFGNYKLYRRVAEGANCLCMKSLPCGQVLGGTGKITEVRTDVSPYAVIDQLTIYGADKAKEIRRGMLLTNDRRTLVIQDEAKFLSPEELYWVGHYPSEDITAQISEDGRCATLTHKDGEKIKLTLLGTDGKFEVMTCYDFLLDNTANCEGEHSREDYRRLVVKLEGVTKLNMAVAVEVPEDAGYTEIIPMSEWKNI